MDSSVPTSSRKYRRLRVDSKRFRFLDEKRLPDTEIAGRIVRKIFEKRKRKIFEKIIERTKNLD